jgi:hypothetical protein
MTDDNFLQFSFPAVSRKQITAAFDGGRLTSDGGVMLLAMAEPVVDKSKRCLGGAECLVMAHSGRHLLLGCQTDLRRSKIHTAKN